MHALSRTLRCQTTLRSGLHLTLTSVLPTVHGECHIHVQWRRGGERNYSLFRQWVRYDLPICDNLRVLDRSNQIEPLGNFVVANRAYAVWRVQRSAESVLTDHIAPAIADKSSCRKVESSYENFAVTSGMSWLAVPGRYCSAHLTPAQHADLRLPTWQCHRTLQGSSDGA